MYTLNAVKLRNSIHALRPDLKVELKNIRINEAPMGCSGFVTDPATGRVVYVSTDRNHGTNDKALVRVARDTKDYTGGHNHMVGWGVVAHAVVSLLADERAHALYTQTKPLSVPSKL